MPDFTKVEEHEILEEINWDDDTYHIVDKEAYKESVFCCYGWHPKGLDLSKCKYFMDPDTPEQFKAKDQAAKHALQYLMDRYDKKVKDEKYPFVEHHQEMLESRATKYFACLRTFHALAF